MKFTRLFATFGLFLLLTACGGGGTSDSASPGSSAPPRWDRGELNFASSSVGSTTVRTALLTNDSSSTASFTSFSRLPAGVTATGCASVAPGAGCTVTFTYAPTTVGADSGDVHPSNAAASTLRISVDSLPAVPPAVGMYPTAQGTSWAGDVSIPGPNGTTLVVKAIQLTDASCSVTVQGTYLTEFANFAFDFGAWRLTIPSQGVMSTAGNVTSTTFTQPVEQGKCNPVAGRPNVPYWELDLVY